jgi:hypothetical protein
MVILQRYFSMKNGACKTYYRRHVRRTVARVLLQGIEQHPRYKSLGEKPTSKITVGYVRGWFRLMLKLFRHVRSLDQVLVGLCTEGDREVIRDILRYAIARCPYREFRTFEGLEAAKKIVWLADIH